MLSNAMKLAVLFGTTLLSVANAAPQEEFAFNSQLPPVARWGQQYTYELSSDTYKSTQGETVNYSASNLPSWLSLNGRTLSGTPSGGQGDQKISFQLDASDSTGTASSQCTLQITNEKAPNYSPAELEKTLKESGEIATPNSYVLVPGKPFEIEFPEDFFSSDGRSVVGHYAVTGDHSPLPIWLDFDGAAGKFSGTAPTVNSGIAQAQQFPISYIVSTFPGFASGECEFNLLLGANVLSMNMSTDPVNATVNQQFTYEVPFSQITLNGVEIQQSNISDVTANIPSDAQSWLSFDKSSYSLSGVPPESSEGTNFTVDMSLSDKYQDSVSWGVQVVVNDRDNMTVFTTSSLPSANATRGKFFEYPLEDYLLNKNVELKISADSASWLSLNEDNLTLTGMVPYSFRSSVVNITASGFSKRDANYEAVSKDKDSSMTAHLSLYGSGPMSSMSSSMRSSSKVSSTARSSTHASSSRVTSSSARHHSHTSGFASSTATGSKTGSSASSGSTATGTGLSPVSRNGKHSTNSVAIGCGVGIPVGIIVIAALAFLVFWCCRRRRRAAAATTADGSPTDMGPNGAAEISAPRPSSKGMAMAPVFRSESSDSSLYDDALEGDDGTIFGTPDKTEKLNKGEEAWDSPQRASTMNFLAMDGTDDGDSTGDTLPLPRQPDETTITNISPISNAPGAIPQHMEDDDVLGDMPRESWRHTNTGDRRWQDARLSQSSMASIVPTEPPTVQMASQEFSGERPMEREYSSGVLHRVGSHSSSTYTSSQSGAPEENRLSQQLTEHYRSASSGGSRASNDLSDDSIANFRAYRDENGELQWREQEDAPGAARLGAVGLDRKASEAKTPKGDTGEFVFV